MPHRASSSSVGCVAISALPPLNGFVSEWLTFQAILQSPELPQWGLKILVPAVGALLALSAALAAACFVKAFGITFLGRPRSRRPRAARGRGRPLLAGAMFAWPRSACSPASCRASVIDALAPVTLSLVGERMPVQTAMPWLSIVPIAESRSSYNGLLVFAVHRRCRPRRLAVRHPRFASRARAAPRAGLGLRLSRSQPATQYTAGSFAQPIRRVFGTLGVPAREQVEMPPPGDTRPARLTSTVRDLVWDALRADRRAVGLAADRSTICSSSPSGAT
jgi:hydrogenase-4 component B